MVRIVGLEFMQMVDCCGTLMSTVMPKEAFITSIDGSLNRTRCPRRDIAALCP